MKYRNHLGAFCCVFCLFGSLAGPTGDETKKEQSVTASLANARSDRVEKVVIYYIPEEFMPVRAIDEASLEVTSYGSVTLRNFGSARIRDGLLATLKEGSMTATESVSADYRWGCIFYGPKNQRLVSLYLTKGGSGRINDILVKTDGKTLEFLRTECEFLVRMW
jgi:hypothetical protein